MKLNILTLFHSFLLGFIFSYSDVNSQTANSSNVNVNILFDKPLHNWDGFGVNYVETRHTRDYHVFDQDYGGFKYLNDEQRNQIIELVFGKDGLKPSIIKMFADPFMEIENDNDDPFDLDLSRFDHTTTTQWIRYFATEGMKETRKWGGNLTVFAGIYGPPAFTTKQKILRGRDLDLTMKEELAEFIVAWAKYIKEELGLPVKYISMHNEGEELIRWKADGGDDPEMYAHDYNIWWPYYQIVDFLKYADDVLYANNMLDVKITSGETKTWRQFHTHQNCDSVEVDIARAISLDPEAMKNLGLITSHGFLRHYDSDGVDVLRQKNPGLHAWTTSYTWGEMNVDFVEDSRRLIYDVKNNGLIPWATVHHDYESDKLSPPRDFRKSGNANSPIKTNNGEVEITKAYYYYKQISRAGQPGMRVASVDSNNDQITAIAFEHNNTLNPDAFVVINKGDNDAKIKIQVSGHEATASYLPIVTSDPNFSDKDYEQLSIIKSAGNSFTYNAPARSSTTFYKTEK